MIFEDAEKCDVNCELLKALGHPIRLKIVIILLSNPGLNVNKLSRELRIPQSTTSQHIQTLKNNMILKAEKTGVDTFYKVINEKVVKIIEILY